MHHVHVAATYLYAEDLFRLDVFGLTDRYIHVGIPRSHKSICNVPSPESVSLSHILRRS